MTELLPLPDLKFSVAVNPGRIVGCRGDLKWLSVSDLFIDKTYQRDVGGSGKNNIRRIVENFTWHLFSPLIVSPRPGGRYAVIDGQHRAIAAKIHGGVQILPCLVLHCSKEEEARAFAVINGNVTKVTAQYLFRARIAGGEETAVGANRAAQNAGVRILLTAASAQDIKFNETQAPGTIETCFKTHGERILTDALSLIVRASKGQRGCLRGGSIIAFCDLLRYHPKWHAALDRVIDVIAGYGLLKLVNECMAKDPNDTGIKGSMRFELLRRSIAMLRPILGDGGTPAKKPPPPPRIGRRNSEHKPLNPEAVKALKPNHPAIVEKRTLFPSTVIAPAESPALLISGKNSPKLGDAVRKGEWQGFPIYQLSLEERATCPSDCHVFNQCYGNAMPFARRHKADADLIPILHAELVDLQHEHPKGFVVRLHVLGDFYSVEYVNAWAQFLKEFPALHVFGYTARAVQSDIGAALWRLSDKNWKRFAIRFSGPKPQGQGATTIWRKPEAAKVAEGIVCPAQTEASACCATCGLCWSEAARSQTIVFVGHGGVGSQPGVKHVRKTPPKVEQQPDAAKRQALMDAATRRPVSDVPATAAKPVPTIRPSVPANERELIEQHLKTKGVRKFEAGDSSEPWVLIEYLKKRGVKVENAPQSVGRKYTYRGRTIDFQRLVQIANAERSKEGKPPLSARAA